jgi:NitT/TauT family transport system permease protein
MTLAGPLLERDPAASPQRSRATGGALPRGEGLAAVLAPVAAGLAALLLHWLLPNRQIALPTKKPYPLLLEVFLAITAALAVAQWAWWPLRAGVRHYGPLLAGAAVWLAVWDLVTLKLAWLPLPYFPGPDRVLQAVWDDSAMLLDGMYSSLRRLLAGYFAGVTLGLISGVLMGWFREVRYWGVPVMKLLGPIPATALVPTAMVLFPGNFFTGVALIALAVWFPVTMLTMSGIINVPASYFDVARTLGARRGYLIFRVAIPAALPSIFIGLFMGLLASFLVVVVAEGVGVTNGLGWYLNWRQSSAEYDCVFGVLFIMAALFSGIVTLLFRVRDRVLGWQKGVIRW